MRILVGRPEASSSSAPELLAVVGLAAGARDQHLERGDVDRFRVGDEPAHSGRDLVELRGRDVPVGLDVGAEAQHQPLGHDRLPVVHHEQAHSVRTHVYDPDRHGVMVKMPPDGSPNAFEQSASRGRDAA